MKVTYELTLDDCNVYAKEAFFIKQVLLYFIKANLRDAVIDASLLSLCLSYLFFNFSIISIIALFIGIFVLVYFYWGVNAYFSGGKYIYKMLDGFDKNYELIIENNFIKRTSGTIEISFAWNNVKEIYNTPKNLLIFLGGRQAIFIPKRIFNNEQEINDLWNFILSCYQNN